MTEARARSRPLVFGLSDQLAVAEERDGGGRPKMKRCCGCGNVFQVAPRGPVPNYCRRYCDPAQREARTAHEARYVKQQNGRAARNRASQAKYQRVKDELPDYIVANLMKMKLAEVPPQLLELKRQQLTAHRMARQLKEATRESSKDPR